LGLSNWTILAVFIFQTYFGKYATIVKVGNTVKMGKSGTLLLYTRKLGTRKMICAKKPGQKGSHTETKKSSGKRHLGFLNSF